MAQGRTAAEEQLLQMFCLETMHEMIDNSGGLTPDLRADLKRDNTAQIAALTAHMSSAANSATNVGDTEARSTAAAAGTSDYSATSGPDKPTVITALAANSATNVGDTEARSTAVAAGTSDSPGPDKPKVKVITDPNDPRFYDDDLPLGVLAGPKWRKPVAASVAASQSSDSVATSQFSAKK
jgi:hypothetical protein